MTESQIFAAQFLEELNQLKMDDWTEGPPSEVGQRLAALIMIERAVKDLIGWIQDSLVLSMEEDEMPVPGFGALRRVPAESTRWRDENASADFRKDVFKAIEDEVSVNVGTGEVDMVSRNIARAVLREVDDALPAFSSIKATGRKRLGIDVTEYRITEETWKVQLAVEADEG